ncbi:MAG: DciA family protein [Burkholderiales bacterium]
MSVRALTTFIQAEPALKPLLRRLSELNYVQQIYFQIIPAPLAKLGQVGSFGDGTLIIFAENGAGAAKLKQVLPEVAEKISQQLQKTIEVRVSVQPESLIGNTKLSRHHKSPMSPESIQSFRKLADDLPPSPLKEEVALLISRQTRIKGS